MIRTSYPVPPMTQIRLRLELATRRTRRALEQRRRVLRAEAEARRAADDDYLRLRWREDLARERAAFTEFYDQYDSLVGLLCLAAHEGIEPRMETEYRERRAWFCARYPKVKSLLNAHLEGDASDTLPGLWGRRACDAFEALFYPASIAAMLETDNGNLIGRLMRTQTALGLWETNLTRKESAACVASSRRPRAPRRA